MAHPSHQQQRQSDQPDSSQKHDARADPVNERPRQYSKGQSCEKEPEQKPLCYLSPGKAQRFHEVRIENREAIEKNSDCQEKIQERGGNNPPAVVDAFRGKVRIAEGHPSPERRLMSRRMRSL